MSRDRSEKLERYRLFGVPENWVVDAAVGSFDVWGLADGVEVPATLGGGDALEWSPPTGAPTLTIDVAEVLRG